MPVIIAIIMTPFIKKTDVKKNWYLINAENAAGRSHHSFQKF